MVRVGAARWRESWFIPALTTISTARIFRCTLTPDHPMARCRNEARSAPTRKRGPTRKSWRRNGWRGEFLIESEPTLDSLKQASLTDGLDGAPGSGGFGLADSGLRWALCVGPIGVRGRRDASIGEFHIEPFPGTDTGGTVHCMAMLVA